eukprot:GCRY01001327.1.p1 GENE.GCRY01001327.1~~GCRY01001327.1.p1  ORF type:complete len:514 (+),score=152.04 GCRY01001327.1:490-2031(+)
MTMNGLLLSRRFFPRFYSTARKTLENSFDLVVVGGGPGGYVCAIKAAQLGMKVACVEKRGALGGTCLNVGCIPSKALLHSSHLFSEAQNTMKKHGVIVKGLGLDLPAVMKQKDTAVNQLTKGIEGLFKMNKVEYIKGAASFLTPHSFNIEMPCGGTREISAEKVVIATGSEVSSLPRIAIDDNSPHIISSTGALSLPRVPNHLVVIGAGVIGVELGSVWKRFGAKVTFVEYADHILNGADLEIANTAQKLFQRQKMKFLTGSKVIGADLSTPCCCASSRKGSVTPPSCNDATVTLQVENMKTGKISSLEADSVLCCVGRKPHTAGLRLENAKIQVDEAGRIPVSDSLCTEQPHIFAIGDVIRGPMLAHKAEDEGVYVANRLAGAAAHINYDTIPSVVYTAPEIAWVGKTEEELKQAGIPYRAGRFPFLANSRAKAVGQTEGLVKVLAHRETGALLGGHLITGMAGEMVNEFTVAMEAGLTAEALGNMCHPHPTFSEAVKEACMLAAGIKAIHC